MSLPRIIVTGASGFIGRHLLESIKEDFQIYGLARRSQLRCGAPVHPNIRWFQVDIGDDEPLAKVFEEIAEEGGAEFVIHLAAHYDFTGDRHPEYERTNVHGLRNVLEQCRIMGIQRFVFSSSLAACAFPLKGESIDEDTPPDGDHIYAKTKAIGERMLDEYREAFPSTIVRFAALFSDWCEYPPFFLFLQTWLSRAWNSRVIGGKGNSAIPYLHIRDAVSFLERVIERAGELVHGQVVIASVDGAVSHEELFLGATHYHFGDMRQPINMPKFLVRPGIRIRCLLGRLFREMPFERPWMAAYVDKSLTVRSRQTHELLGWQPRHRLEIIRRMPFLLENLKADPVEWNRRNRAAMKLVRVRPNLKIHALLNKHEAAISDAFTEALTREYTTGKFPSYQKVDEAEHRWNHRLVLRQLMNAVRTRERGVFLSYCGDLAERRFGQGFQADEICGALVTLERLCIDALMRDDDSADVLAHLHDHISINIRFGCDQVQESFELLEARKARRRSKEAI